MFILSKFPAFLCVLAATFCSAALAGASPQDTDRLVDCGSFKAVIIHGTESADGRYAAGWTISPQKKSVAPVDWSLWDPDDTGKLLDHCHLTGLDDPDDYEVDYFAINLRTKKTLGLPEKFDDAQGETIARWTGPVNGSRYALFEFPRHYAPSIELVAIDPNGEMRLINTADLDNAVSALLPAPDAANPQDAYLTVYSLDDPRARFHAAYADIPFVSQVYPFPDGPTISGIATLRLEDGKVTHLSSNAPSAEAAALSHKK